MAVSAHASLLSFLHLLDHINHPSLHWLRLDQQQIQNCHQMVTFLLDFIRDYDSHHLKNGVIDRLLREMAEAVDEPEAMIHSHVVDQLRSGWGDSDRTAGLSALSKHVNVATQKMESIKNRIVVANENGIVATEAVSSATLSLSQKFEWIKNQIMVVKDKWFRRQDTTPWTSVPSSTETALPSQPASSMILSPPGKNRMVGFDAHLSRILDKLTGAESGLQIITITGMGGSGKTTLATNVYEHPNIVRHFDKRIWITVSQEYNLHRILQNLLDSLGNRGHGSGLSELGDRLHKTLFGRRYLIVMDDVWSIEACEDFKKFFPNYENRSRILVTTRSSNVATYIGSHQPYPIGFLDEHNSRELFCQKAFNGGSFPPELVVIGNFIVKSCRGLPLAIAVVGGLLAKSSTEPEFWESFARNMNSFANSADGEHCSSILSLSYTNLPIHLKPCFLHLCRFMEDAEIRVSMIVRMWIAEGLVKPTLDKSLEQIAKEYLADLSDRNMIIIRQWGSTGKIKSFVLHDLLRDFCQKRSGEECFIRIPRTQTIAHRMDGWCLCFQCGVGKCIRVAINLEMIGSSIHSKSLVPTFVCKRCARLFPCLPRLRVIDTFDQSSFGQSSLPKVCASVSKGDQYLLLTETSYVRILDTRSFSTPCLIHILWRLQTLIIGGRGRRHFCIPLEVLELPQLRHLDTGKRVTFPHLEGVTMENKGIVVLENLHTVKGGEFRLTDEMLKRTPNVKKLKIWYKEKDYYERPNFDNICRLDKLEVLDLELLCFSNPIVPDSIRKLVLTECQLCSGDLAIVGLLPNLEVLRLLNLNVEAYEWCPDDDDGFVHLRVLEIRGDWLTLWEVESGQFRRLEILRIGYNKTLNEIPSGIGEIDTLQAIHATKVGEPLLESIKLMVEEQRDLGNESIRLYVDSEQHQFEDPSD